MSNNSDVRRQSLLPLPQYVEAKQEGQARKKRGRRIKDGKVLSNLNWFQTDYDKLLKKDCFGENPIHLSAMFRRCFWMRWSLFEKILDDLVASDSYFSQKKDALGFLGFSPHQKLTLALCMLAYGTSADQWYNLTRMSESTTLNSLQHFCNAIINRYGKE